MDSFARLLGGAGRLVGARGGGSSLGPLGPLASSRSAGAAAAAASLPQRRHLHLHEFQSMHLLTEFGVKTPSFSVCYTPAEALSATAQMQQQHPGRPVMVKAQVLAGGRGLGHFKENGFRGGVHQCSSPDAASETAGKMLGNTLVTKQTGEAGKPCSVVMVCERLDVKREMYLAMLMDRGSGGPVIIGSAVGGTSIEDIAKRHPEAIFKMPIDIEQGLDEDSLLRFMDGLGVRDSAQRSDLSALVRSLHRLFTERDCLLIELNPLVETAEGRLLAADAKLNFDDNAAFRQKELFALRDKTQEDPKEVEAEVHQLNYIKLKGDIGCMVNGAGLAMATMDLIHLKGGAPANFLDVGGGASEQQIVEALKLIQKDEDAKAVLINIFGGIMRCDIIAEGLIKAVKHLGFSKPLVIRLEGTNKEQAEAALAAAFKKEKSARVEGVPDFDKAAERAVQLAREL